MVVIAIIGILIALLLPALQAAREAARRSQCANNMKQMGFATHNYHDTFRCFPPDTISPGESESTQKTLINWAIALLPFLEQQPLYDLYDHSAYNQDLGLNNGNKIVRESIVNVYVSSAARSTAGETYGRLARRRFALLALVAGLLCTSLVADVMIGPAELTVREVLNAVCQPGQVESAHRTILWTYRIPTSLFAAVVGVALGVAGAQMQTILNNPLASPYTLGVSAGACFGASLVNTRNITELSGGQLQMVSIAQALVREPRILLLDEPTSNLDLQHQFEICSIIARLTASRGMSTAMALHDLNVAARFADTVIVLKAGAVYRSGTPAEVLTETMIAEVYRVAARVTLDDDGTPLVTPLGLAR